MRQLTLVFIAGGGVELLDERERQLWSGDDDDDFAEELELENLGVDDAPEVISYLVGEQIVTEREADHILIEEEELEEDELGEGEESDGELDRSLEELAEEELEDEDGDDALGEV